MNSHNKILFLVFTPRFSGAEVLLLNLIRTLSYQNFFIACSDSSFVPSELHSKIILIDSISSLNRRNSLKDVFRILKTSFNYYSQITKLVKSEKIDLMFINNLQLAVYTLPIAIVSKLLNRHKLFIWYDHNLLFYGVRFGGLLEKLCNLFYDKTIILSELFLKKYLVKKNILVIPNCVDTKKFCFRESSRIVVRSTLNIDSTKIVIGSFGDISERKGTLELLKVFAELIKPFPNLHLLIIGKINFINKGSMIEFDKIIAALGNSISYLKWTSNIEAYYSAIDIYVNTSKSSFGGEAMPNTILEAMASERVVLAADNGAVSEVIDDSINGFIYHEKSTEPLREKLYYILNNVSDLRNISLEARKKIKNNFDIELVKNKFESLLNDYVHP